MTTTSTGAPKNSPVPSPRHAAPSAVSAAPPGAAPAPSSDAHLQPSPASGSAGTHPPADAAASRAAAENDLVMTAPEAVRVIKTALETADLDTKLETAWRVLDKARVGGVVGAGSAGVEIGPVLGEALRGAFAGLAAGLGLKAVEKNVTPPTKETTTNDEL